MKRHEDAQKALMLDEGLALKLKRICALCVFLWLCFVVVSAQESRNLTPVQNEIDKQQRRLSSSDVEERRDAVMRLGSMRLAAASRAALPALQDAEPIVRATTAKAILSIGNEESAGHLLPLLNDKDEFVRREAAYALGHTRSRSATAALSDRLLNDKEDGVRGAAAVALGQIADEAAVIALVGTSRRNYQRRRIRNESVKQTTLCFALRPQRSVKSEVEPELPL